MLEVLLAEVASGKTVDRYGAEIGRLADLPTGTVHPILARLEGRGWVTSDWEDVDPSSAGRPARRYYRLSTMGIVAAREALARPHGATRVTSGVLHPPGGLDALGNLRGTAQEGAP